MGGLWMTRWCPYENRALRDSHVCGFPRVGVWCRKIWGTLGSWVNVSDVLISSPVNLQSHVSWECFSTKKKKSMQQSIYCPARSRDRWPQSGPDTFKNYGLMVTGREMACNSGSIKFPLPEWKWCHHWFVQLFCLTWSCCVCVIW